MVEHTHTHTILGKLELKQDCIPNGNQSGQRKPMETGRTCKNTTLQPYVEHPIADLFILLHMDIVILEMFVLLSSSERKL